MSEEKKSEHKIILPTDPKFKKALETYAPGAFKSYLKDSGGLESMGDEPSGLEPTWVHREYPRFHLNHTIMDLSPTQSKIVMHFKKISPQDMETLGEVVYRTLQGTSMSVQAEAGRSPVYRSQWDLIIFTTKFEAPMLRNRILSQVDHFEDFRK
jgi:hypothetical protein